MIKKRSWSQPEADGPDVFTTYDLGVSAALMCLGYKLIRLDRVDPRKALFVFKREAEIDSYEQNKNQHQYEFIDDMRSIIGDNYYHNSPAFHS